MAEILAKEEAQATLWQQRYNEAIAMVPGNIMFFWSRLRSREQKYDARGLIVTSFQWCRKCALISTIVSGIPQMVKFHLKIDLEFKEDRSPRNCLKELTVKGYDLLRKELRSCELPWMLRAAVLHWISATRARIEAAERLMVWELWLFGCYKSVICHNTFFNNWIS